MFLYTINIPFKNTLLFAPIMIHRLVALPGFLYISSVSGIVNVMSFVVQAAPSLHILGSVEVIIIAQSAQCSPDC